MADPKTFTLIGEFKDGITPELAKVNRTLNSFKRTFNSVGGRGARNAARDMGRLNVAVSSLNESLKTQNQNLRAAIVPFREYRREVGKAVGALTRLSAAAGHNRSIEATNRALARQVQLYGQLRTAESRASGGRRARTISPTRSRVGGGGGAGRGGGGDYNFNMGGFAFGYQIGEGLARPLETVLMSGFTAGAALIRGTFQYFAGTVGERVRDEMEDISAAGGYLSIAKRQGDKSFLGKSPTLDKALAFTEETNRIMGRLALDLPGETRQYVQVSKRIGDSVARVVESNEEGAVALAKKLRVGNEQFYKEEVTGGKQAMQVLLGELTKKSVMAGFGGTTGRGGPAGPYGLPGLTERLLTDTGITEAQLSKYASVYGDPKISAAIGRLMPKLDEAGNDMIKRMELINEFYDDIVPAEMVQKMRRSTAGLMEALKGSLFDPELGILGIGRKLTKFGYKMNDFGEYLDAAGNVTTDVTKFVKEDMDIFKMFRDVLANVFMVLQPIVDNLTLIWDPLKSIGLSLNNARHYTAQFYKDFQAYEKGLLAFQKSLPKGQMEKFGQTRKLRASMLAIGNMFYNLGVFSQGDYDKLLGKMKDPDANMGDILSNLFKTFFSSDAAKKVGEFFGTLLGTVLKQLSTITGFFAKRLGAGKITDGFFAAFEAAGGSEAIANIFKDLYDIILNSLKEILPRIPIKIYMLGMLAVLVPAIINALTFGLGQLLSEGIKGVFTRGIGGGLLSKAMGGGARVTGGGRGGGAAGSGLAGAFTTRSQLKTAAKIRRGIGGAAAPYVQGAAKGAAFGKDAFKGLAQAFGATKFGGALTKVARFIPGGAVAAGALDAGLRMMSGQGAGKALGGAAFSMGGSAAGAFIGSIIAPGVGTAIGGIAGGIIGDKIFNLLTPPSIRQEEAAKQQIQASLTQLEAAKEKLGNLGVGDAAGLQGMADPMKLGAAIKLLGLGDNTLVQEYQQNAEKTRLLSDRAGTAKEILEAKIKELEDLGYSKALIAEQADVKALQKTSDELNTALATASAGLDKSFKAMPQWMSRAIVTNMQKLNLKEAENIIATKFAHMQMPQINFKFTAPTRSSTGFNGNGVWEGFQWEAFGSPGRKAGSLGAAIASENKHKPPGSSLVIANSSERIIPTASNGYIPSHSLYSKGYAGWDSSGSVTVNAPITINGAGQNSEEIAVAVAEEISKAVMGLQRSTMFV
jgi:hypothetical protein